MIYSSRSQSGLCIRIQGGGGADKMLMSQSHPWGGGQPSAFIKAPWAVLVLRVLRTVDLRVMGAYGCL